MRAVVLRRLTLGVCFAAAAQAAFALPATPSTTLITACVSRLGGTVRFVNKPDQCLPRFETVVQFNQTGPAGPAGPAGPTGPTGPQGPPGPSNNAPFLVRTVIVPAGGTAAENGQRLLQIINAVESVASPANPYLIQLDAGYFDLGTGARIYPGISLRGAGMLSTFVTASDTTLYFINLGDDSGISLSVQDMTVTATNPTGRPLATPSFTDALLDHVRLNSGPNGLTGLGAINPNASLLITDSVIHSPLNLSDLYADPTVRMRVIGTQVDIFQINGGTNASTLACFASYNSLLVPYTNECR